MTTAIALCLLLLEPSLQVRIHDMAAVAPAVAGGATREAAALLSAAGIEGTWTHEPVGAVTAPGVVHVLLLARPSSRAVRPEVLASTLTRPDARTVWIYVERVRAMAGGPLLPQALQARALGRVLAHEVVHAVAPGLRHTRTGLMRARWDERSLVHPGLALGPEAAAALAASALSAGCCRGPGTPGDAPCTCG